MLQNRIMLLCVLFIALMIVIPAYAQEDDHEHLDVVVTFSILGDVVSQIAGDAANVTVIMPVNADPHAYEPSPQQIIAMTNADVVFSNGMRFEEGIIPIIEAESGINHVVASLCVPVWSYEGHTHDHEGDEHHDDDHDHEGDEHHDHDHDHEGDEHHNHDHDHEGDEHHDDVENLCANHWAELDSNFGTPAYFSHAMGPLYAQDCTGHDDHEDHDGHHHGTCDPHVWMDPNNVILWAYLVRDTLSTLDPNHADIYAENTAAYVEDLATLGRATYASLETIEIENRILITNHQTFGYITNPAHFTVVAEVFPSGSTIIEPSASDLVALIALVRETGVEVIFAENTTSADLLQRIAEESGVEIAILYTDSLSDVDGDAPTYLDLITYNVETIVLALGGEVVEAPEIAESGHGHGHGDDGHGESAATMSAAYFTLTNNNADDVTLIGVATDVAEHVELHETTIDENDIARMTPVADIVIPAGETVSLSQGGLHVMLIDVTEDLHSGDTVTLTLIFADGTELSVDVPVVESALDAPESSVELGGFVITGAWVREIGH